MFDSLVNIFLFWCFRKTIIGIVLFLAIIGVIISPFIDNAKTTGLTDAKKIVSTYEAPKVTVSQKELDNVAIIAEHQKLSNMELIELARILKTCGLNLNSKLSTTPDQLYKAEEIIYIPNQSKNPNINDEHNVVVMFNKMTKRVEYVGVTAITSGNGEALYLYNKTLGKGEFRKKHSMFRITDETYEFVKKTVRKKIDVDYADAKIEQMKLYYGNKERKQLFIVMEGKYSGINRHVLGANRGLYKMETSFKMW